MRQEWSDESEGADGTAPGRAGGGYRHGHARIVDRLSREDQATVQGMCLFATEVQAGAIDPPYTDGRALVYARLAEWQRADAKAAG